MKHHPIRAVVSLFAGVATLAGCVGPTATRADLDRGANEMLDLAEVTLPALAESLGATLTEARLYNEPGGGAEGSTPYVWFTVYGTMAGSKPTQAELEQAVINAGYTDILLRGDDNQSNVVAKSTDGTMKLIIGYSHPSDPHPGLGFSFRKYDSVSAEAATMQDFRKNFPRDFDQSLVHEASD